MAIAFAIVLGISSTIGTLISLIVFAPDQVTKPQGLAVIAGIAIALVGTGIVSWAAYERDARKKDAHHKPRPGSEGSKRNVAIGLGLCITSGVLSSCANLVFSFAGQISQRAREMGGDLPDLQTPHGPLFYFPCSCVISFTVCTCFAETGPPGFFVRPGQPITGDGELSWDSIG